MCCLPSPGSQCSRPLMQSDMWVESWALGGLPAASSWLEKPGAKSSEWLNCSLTVQIRKGHCAKWLPNWGGEIQPHTAGCKDSTVVLCQSGLQPRIVLRLWKGSTFCKIKAWIFMDKKQGLLLNECLLNSPVATMMIRCNTVDTQYSRVLLLLLTH